MPKQKKKRNYAQCIHNNIETSVSAEAIIEQCQSEIYKETTQLEPEQKKRKCWKFTSWKVALTDG